MMVVIWVRARRVGSESVRVSHWRVTLILLIRSEAGSVQLDRALSSHVKVSTKAVPNDNTHKQFVHVQCKGKSCESLIILGGQDRAACNFENTVQIYARLVIVHILSNKPFAAFPMFCLVGDDCAVVCRQYSLVKSIPDSVSRVAC